MVLGQEFFLFPKFVLLVNWMSNVSYVESFHKHVKSCPKKHCNICRNQCSVFLSWKMRWFYFASLLLAYFLDGYNEVYHLCLETISASDSSFNYYSIPPEVLETECFQLKKMIFFWISDQFSFINTHLLFLWCIFQRKNFAFRTAWISVPVTFLQSLPAKRPEMKRQNARSLQGPSILAKRKADLVKPNFRQKSANHRFASISAALTEFTAKSKTKNP